jgi:hypothetical protein
MHIIEPNSMPRFWWLVPWAYARTLKTALVAMKAYADRADRCIDMQIRIADNYRAEVEHLKAEVTRLAHSRDHWLAKHDRAYAVAMHNEKVIADMEARGYVRL